MLAAWTRSYVDGLTQYRHTGSPTSPKAMAAVNTWAARFAAACTRCASDAAVFQARATDLEAQWRTRLGKVRANSATDILLRVLPGAPILTIHSAETLLNRTFKPTHAALHRLIDAGVLQEITLAKRSLAYETPEIIDAFTALERQLASSPGDTRASPPARPVPYRRIQRA